MSVATRQRCRATLGCCLGRVTGWRARPRTISFSGRRGWRAPASFAADEGGVEAAMAARTPKPIPPHPDVVIESDNRVWSGRFPLDVVAFRHRRFDGAMSGTRTWEVWRRGPASALLPYDPVADAVVLIEQFRFPALAAGVEPVLVELPAGLCEHQEDPAETIRR